jgi:GNAT superfamily N-acetyltransferase
MPPSPPSFNISLVESEDDFQGLAAVEFAAFAGPQTTLLFGPSNTPAINASRQLNNWKLDPTTRYLKAFLPSGEIIGMAKWNFFDTPGPHYPWPKDGYAPDANLKFLRWFFGSSDQKRNEVMVGRGKGYLYMAILCVGPEWQRMGVGKRLLEWGLEKADREGLEVWIEASPAGKGLYEKMGWREVGVLDVDLVKWGGKEGEAERTVSMLREVGGKKSSE